MTNHVTGVMPEGWHSIKGGARHHGVPATTITRLIRSGAVTCEKVRVGNFEQWFIEPQSLELAIAREQSSAPLVRPQMEVSPQRITDSVPPAEDSCRDETEGVAIRVEFDRLVIEVRGRAPSNLDVGEVLADIFRRYIGPGQPLTISASGADPALVQ